SVYNVDTGRMVETLTELKTILARWLPMVPSEDERLRRFLALYDASPMPQGLKQELREAGFPVAA
ncbi:MAG: hypothetical protein KGJ86_11650, partial [Chloroflexota bacterium]|nr:hypothetical protein [Chloroflexota bacterium]